MYQTRSELQGQGTGLEEDNCFWFADGGALPLQQYLQAIAFGPSSDPHALGDTLRPRERAVDVVFSKFAYGL